MSRLEIQSLTLSIAEKLLCKDLSFTIEANECWGLLGKNGAGKTSLIHCIAGLREFDTGEIKLNDRNVAEYSRAELAREIGILFQDGLETLPATVLETVMLGRHPHVQSLFKDSNDDFEITHNALRDFSLTELCHRHLDSLSGGEKQRVAIAMLSAQSPNIFLLDEPSNHLDIAFQVNVLKVLNSTLNKRNASMLMATHDINLASRFCDKFILLFEHGEFLCGDKKEVLNQSNLSRAYDCDIQAIETDKQTLFFPI
ncbi:MAG: ATP-binding cassette domain-containing protein [Pseudomonadales bacterium]|nr:ATP-binding cassette domain-containing protein [Pseudomonadales bacterium]